MKSAREFKKSMDFKVWRINQWERHHRLVTGSHNLAGWKQAEDDLGNDAKYYHDEAMIALGT
jgi:hypothetical protein